MANPVTLGFAAEAEGFGAQTTVITTTVAHNAGEPIVVAIATAKTISGVTDSAGNTYSVIVSTASGGGEVLEQYRSSGANALASGGTITISTGGFSSSAVAARAIACP